MLQHKCLGVTLVNPLIIDGQCYTEIFIIEIDPNNTVLQEEIIENIVKKTDTFGDLNIKFFVNGDVVDNASLRTAIISTNNIQEVNLVQ